MEKKLRVYLDTSVISYLYAPDVPEKMAATHRLWNRLNSYEVIMSGAVLQELEKCSEPKRAFMRSKIDAISYVKAPLTVEMIDLSKVYLMRGVLPPKSVNDAVHLAAATVAGCDIVLSWNYKHMVNLRAMTTVNLVNIEMGYALIQIMSPMTLLESEG